MSRVNPRPIYWDSTGEKIVHLDVNGQYSDVSSGSLPSQTGNSGKFLKTDGSAASWDNVSGGSGLVLESYQNSTMSAAVMAYVFRDADDNIVRVYEPIGRNDIQGLSLDSFRFDGPDFFKYCTFLGDSQVINIDRVTEMKSVTLETESSLEVLESGKLLVCVKLGSQAQGVVTSDWIDVQISASGYVGPDSFHGGVNIISVDTGTSTFKVEGDVTETVGTWIYKKAGSNQGYYKVVSATENGGNTDIVVEETIPSDDATNKVRLGKIFGALQYVNINTAGLLYSTTDGITVNSCEIDSNVVVSADANIQGEKYVKIGDVNYKLGVTDGSVTATPV